jgi:signal transduction protein with GAF and PtsI domain
LRCSADREERIAIRLRVIASHRRRTRRSGKFPLKLDRRTVTGRTAIEGKVVHILDAQLDPDLEFAEVVKGVGFRTLLGVPLVREGIPIGVLVLMRKVVQPFTDKHIELVTTFADQAVIAIENVRLFDEVQARTRELSEALEQQTATSEVLSAISGPEAFRWPTVRRPIDTARTAMIAVTTVTAVASQPRKRLRRALKRTDWQATHPPTLKRLKRDRPDHRVVAAHVAPRRSSVAHC